jgi:predicted nuclease with TOPRIM domain
MAVMTPPRESWTDERLDDLKEHMEESFREVRGEIAQLRGEVVELRSEIGEVREGLGEVEAEINGINRTMQIGFGIIGGVMTAMLGLLGLIATQV